MSAAKVSRTGLPFSQLSATASISAFFSITSAMALSTAARSVADASPQASLAACAASRASSTSSGVDSATSVIGPGVAGPITEVAESTPEDVELALDAAHAAKDAWGEASATERAAVLNAIADVIEKNAEMLAVAESWENGKPVRETLAADIPLMVDHFRYFAAAARSEEGSSTEIDKDLVAYHFREPLGVVGQIVPFNFPLLMEAWKLAPALAAGNCSVLKPASPTPWSIMKLMEVIEDVCPPGVINVVTGPGAEIGKALATNTRIAKIAFTGETVTGRLIMQYAAQNLIPSTTELGGKSPVSYTHLR